MKKTRLVAVFGALKAQVRQACGMCREFMEWSCAPVAHDPVAAREDVTNGHAPVFHRRELFAQHFWVLPRLWRRAGSATLATGKMWRCARTVQEVHKVRNLGHVDGG